MKTIRIGSNETMGSVSIRQWAGLKALLVCGIIASFLSVAVDIFAGKLWDDYSFFSRSISDLSAIGAPTRLLVVPLNLMAQVLLIAFALGVWDVAGRNRTLRITAGMLLGNATFQLIGAFFPFHLGEALSTSANTMNTIVIGASVLFLMLAMGFGAGAYRNWFRFYSIAMFLVFFVEDIWATWDTPFVLAGQRGPLVGVQERTMYYGYLLWIMVLAITLLRTQKRGKTMPREIPKFSMSNLTFGKRENKSSQRLFAFNMI